MDGKILSLCWLSGRLGNCCYVEWILFRGFIQTYLSQYFDTVYTVFEHELPLAGFIAALIFTVAHVGFTVSPVALSHFQLPQLLLAFVLGIYYAIAYHETGSLVAPVIAHNVVNGVIIVATLLAAQVLL
ncbi:CPBP family intramembrane glutamic endopeptidase [Halegenticoccus tardaugens]|uniref:CPBP family intramembrane glutamic endopeptidase n=1 Tax=Halegenticoccus tardaugens TaxID=2071624 RepID=UPI00100A34F7|nr:CPBP family intramembrane glutamic endopeptidase [Halegenticoccus tardaugens]